MENLGMTTSKGQANVRYFGNVLRRDSEYLGRRMQETEPA